MGQQQVQQPDLSQGHTQKGKQFPWKRIGIVFIIIAFLLAFACLILWNLINVHVLHGDFFDTLSKILVAIGAAATAIGAFLGVYVGIASSFKTIFASSNNKTKTSFNPADKPTMPPIPPPTLSPSPINLQLPLTEPTPPTTPTPQLLIPIKPPLGHTIGSFPPTDPKTILQRKKVVEEVYTELTKPDVTCIVLTGIGGVGKSTVAALVHRYAEDQRKGGVGPFKGESLWATVEATTTFADLAEMVSTALSKPIPDVTKLPLQQQAASLFNVLDMADTPRLIVVNQFENFLDGQMGWANDPGVGQWIDMLNSRLCHCHVLLTSRPMPRGTHDYPPTHMQEYRVEGLEVHEGVDLLRKQGVEKIQALDMELLTAVTRCEGHALSLKLLASILRSNRSLRLATLLDNDNQTYSHLWRGDIARNLLNYIYAQQLDDVQRNLLCAFSVYRIPVPLEASLAVMDSNVKTTSIRTSTSVTDALGVLLAQHLLQGIGNECYQLHAIVADYALHHFDTESVLANRRALRVAHSKAALYYIQQAVTNCPARGGRRNVDDVKPLIEAIWQQCQAGQWQEAYNLMQQENLFSDLSRWGNNAVLYELIQMLLPSREWQPERLEKAQIYSDLGQVCNDLGKNEQSLEYYRQALDIQREMRDHRGEGNTLHNIGMLYLRRGRLEYGFACLRLALYRFETIRNPSDCEKEKQWLDQLRKAIGTEQYNKLVKDYEPHTYELVEQALHEGL